MDQGAQVGASLPGKAELLLCSASPAVFCQSHSQLAVPWVSRGKRAELTSSPAAPGHCSQLHPRSSKTQSGFVLPPRQEHTANRTRAS